MIYVGYYGVSVWLLVRRRRWLGGCMSVAPMRVARISHRTGGSQHPNRLARDQHDDRGKAKTDRTGFGELVN